jgi:hypothetical protein
MKKAITRSNEKLNLEILKHIADWNGTVHGSAIKTMWDNGDDYEKICEAASIDINKFPEEAVSFMP